MEIARVETQHGVDRMSFLDQRTGSGIAMEEVRTRIKQHATIREMLGLICSASILFAIPSWIADVSLAPSVHAWMTLLYNALLFAVAAWGIGVICSARRLFLSLALSFFVVTFAPELIFATEFSLTGDNERTGPWLAEHGLDYDPTIYVPLSFHTGGS